MAKANVSIDPGLLPMFGRSLYKEHNSLILVRELVQNALDACKRRNVKPEINLLLAYDSFADKLEVTCSDNGIGMTDDDIENKFLKLGGKGKNLGIGGFGIAKAAIVTNRVWKVESLDWVITSEDLLAGDVDIRKSGHHVDGTIVYVSIDQATDSYRLRNIHRYLLAGNNDLHLTYIEDGRTTFNDQIVGGTGFKLLQSTAYCDIFIGEKITFQCMAGNDITLEGYNIMRLGGLVQYMTYSGNRTTNLVFEIKTDLRPGDEKYPFDLARENIKGDDLIDLVQSTISHHTQNALTSQRVASTNQAPKKKEIHLGKTICGQRSRHNNEVSLKHAGDNPTHNILTVGQLMAAIAASENGETRRVAGNPNDVTMLLYDYEAPTDEVEQEWHAKVLRAWQNILELVATDDDHFGIGLTTEEGVRASRHYSDGTTFYLLNPSCLEQAVSVEGKVMILWQKAIHETSHAVYEDHSEWFTSLEGTIAQATADGIFVELKRIAKLLR